MKKFVSLTLVISILLTFMALPGHALASEQPPGFNVSYHPLDETLGTSDGVTDRGTGAFLRAYTIYDLGTNGKSNITWALGANKTERTTQNYKTGTGKFILSINTTATVNVTISLYDSTDTFLGEYSTQFKSGYTTKAEIVNLFTTRVYYMKITNNGGTAVTLTGTISAA